MSQDIDAQKERDIAKILACPELSEAQRAVLTRWNLDAQSAVNRRKALKPASRAAYLFPLKRLALSAKKPFEDMSEADLKQFFAEVEKSQREGATTLTGAKTYVKSFFKWLGRPEVVAWIKVPRRTGARFDSKDLITRDEVARVMAAVRSTRDRAIIATLYESAARIDELAALRVGDVKLDEDGGARVELRGKTGKRVLYLVESRPDLGQWLAQHPTGDPDDPLWTVPGADPVRRLRIAGIRNMINYATKKALGRRVNPHLFRHSRLTEIAAQGKGDSYLRQWAGWTRDSQMPATYIHMSGEAIETAVKRDYGIEEKNEKVRSVKRCPRCGAGLPINARYCFCGEPIAEEAKAKLKEEQDKLQYFEQRLREVDGIIDKIKELLLPYQQVLGMLEDGVLWDAAEKAVAKKKYRILGRPRSETDSGDELDNTGQSTKVP